MSWAAIAEIILRPMPRSLTTEQIGPPATKAERPIAVLAWVDFPQGSVQIEGRATAWTATAVEVTFSLRDGVERTAWVWASAVSRR